MHSEFEEFFVVFAELPAVLLHLSAELIQRIGVVELRIFGGELEALFLRQVDDLLIELAGQTARLPEDHAPRVVVDSLPAALADGEVVDVHQSDVLDVLAEWRDEWGIAEARPYVGDFVEEADEQVVDAQLGFALLT